MKSLCLALFLLINTLVPAAFSMDLVIFGDSLSDNGNVFAYSHQQFPPASWYYQGRYSNGPVWSDYLSAEFFAVSGTRLHIHNYAFGGSGVLRIQAGSFLLSQEIDSYLSAHHDTIAPDSVIVIWIGANDYLPAPDARGADVTAVIDAIADNISRLLAAGAQHVMLGALPDLGCTPFARQLDLRDELSALTETHNQKLAEMFDNFQADYPMLDWIYVDLNQLFHNIMVEPHRYGLANTVDPCRVPQNKSAAQQSHPKPERADCRAYLFYDQLHPTTAVHRSIARYFAKLLSRHTLRCNSL